MPEKSEKIKGGRGMLEKVDLTKEISKEEYKEKMP